RLVPDTPRRPVLRNFFEEVAVRVEEERKLRSERIYVQTAANPPFHIFEAVTKRKRKLLYRRRSGFADVIAADGNRIELGSVLDGELESIDDQAHRWLGRINVFLLRDVFLKDVVLQRAGDLLPIRPLLFGNGEIHRPDNSRWRIDG